MKISSVKIVLTYHASALFVCLIFVHNKTMERIETRTLAPCTPIWTCHTSKQMRYNYIYYH